MSQIAQRYGRAFFELAQEKGVAKDVANELLALQNLLSQSRDLQRLSSSKKYSRHDIQTVFGTIAEAMNLSPLTRRFIAFLGTEGRLALLSTIASDFHRRWQKDQGIVSVSLTSAGELSKKEDSSTKEALEAHLGKKVTLHTKIKQDLVGGVLIQIGSVLIDHSLKTKLNDMTDIIRGV